MRLEDVYVALGANLDDPARQLRSAFEELAMLPATRLAAISSLYSNPAVGYVDQPDFVNAVAQIETELTPAKLMELLQSVEAAFGRA